jgi:hypothetical protein
MPDVDSADGLSALASLVGSPGSAPSPSTATPAKARTPGRQAVAQPLPEPPQLLKAQPREHPFADPTLAALYPFKAAEESFTFLPPKKAVFLKAVQRLVDADDGKGGPVAPEDVSAAQEHMCTVVGVNYAEASSETHVRGSGERSWSVRFSTLLLRRIISTSKDSGGTFADYYYK